MSAPPGAASGDGTELRENARSFPCIPPRPGGDAQRGVPTIEMWDLPSGNCGNKKAPVEKPVLSELLGAKLFRHCQTIFSETEGHETN